jgi:hypothetical protein
MSFDPQKDHPRTTGIKIVYKIRLAFNRLKSDHLKPRVSQFNIHPLALEMNVSEETKPAKG